MHFEIDDVVSTVKGKGVVSYVEDHYMEVVVGGNEMSFSSPFTGVKPYVEPVKVDKNLHPDNDRAVAVLKNIPDSMTIAGKIMHLQGARLVQMVGGSAEPWEKLSAWQKLNFVAAAEGTLAGVLMDKWEEVDATA